MNALERSYEDACRTHHLTKAQALLLRRAMAGGFATITDGRSLRTAEALERKGLVTIDPRTDRVGRLYGHRVTPVEETP